MENPDQETLYQNALARLNESGYKLTQARRIVLQILCQHEAHLTSADVIQQAVSEHMEISRASIFRTLDLLTELAIIRPTYLKSGTPSYIVLPASGHHAHIICPQCEQVIEIDSCEIEDSLHAIEQRYNVRVSGHLLEIYGTCDQCAVEIDKTNN
ncbi:transcriptional repressor [bacterium]|nr:transcriptional repressor [bacterium]MCB2179012.1 transcriptional repressor [bacterium]